MIDFSYDLLSLYPVVHFLRMRSSDIKAIMNSKSDRKSPWKIPLWIFASAKLHPPAVDFTLHVFMFFSIKFLISYDILHILWLFIIQLCGTTSYAFL